MLRRIVSAVASIAIIVATVMLPSAALADDLVPTPVDVPVVETPVEETPVEETPVVETPVDGTPVDEIPDPALTADQPAPETEPAPEVEVDAEPLDDDLESAPSAAERFSAFAEPEAALLAPGESSGVGSDTFTVPAGVYALSVTAWGASGGSVTPQYGTTQGGGTGGGVTSVINVTPGQVLQVVTGAVGSGTAGSTGALGTSGAGGGATDIRAGACAATLSCGLADRIIVAGGGGGASAVSGDYRYPVICGGGGGAGTDGSGAAGCTRNQSGIDWPHGGGGGTPTAGGYAGARSGYYGGNAGAAGSSGVGGSGAAGGSSGGSGGSGFFGGGGGGAGTQPSETANNVPGGGGGGGSSWATPTALSTTFLGSSRNGNGTATLTPVSGSATPTTLASSTASLAAGLALSFTATVSGVSTGTVAFFSNTAPIAGCGAVAVSSGTAVCATSFATVGSRSVTAIFSGTASLLPSTAAAVVVSVVQRSTSVVVTSSAATVTAASPVTYTATVSPVTDGGSITFSRGGVAIASCTNVGVNTSNGLASCTESYANSGDRQITAAYSGTDSYTTSTSASFVQHVSGTATATTLSTDTNPTGVGGGVIYTSVTTPVPTSGTVAFTDNGSTIAGCGVVPINITSGAASCNVSYAVVGSHPIVATYGGNTDYATSASATLTQTVSSGASNYTSVASHYFTVPAGVYALSVTAWGASGGSVTPQYGTTQGGGTGGGVTSVISVTPGQVLQVVTGGVGGGTAGSTGALGTSGGGGGATDVRAGSCAATLSCGLADRIIVAGGGGGSSAVSGNYQYPVICGGGGGAGTDGSGAAGCTRSQSGIDWPHGGGGGTPTAGGYAGARSGYYGGNAGATGSVGVGGSGAAGGSSGGSGGSGFFGGGGGGAGTQPSETANNVPGGGGGGGSSWATPTALSTTFLGSSRNGDGTITITPVAATTTTTTTVVSSVSSLPAAASLTFTATVTGVTTGTVAFFSNTSPITGCGAVSLASGPATCTTSFPTVGSRAVTAIYSGTATLLPSTAPATTVSVVQRSTTAVVTSSAASVAVAVPVTYSATISPVPNGGTVAFSRGGAVIANCAAAGVDTSTGVATCTESYLASGDRQISAVYSGTADFSTATSATFTQVVLGSPTTTVVTSPVNPSAAGQGLTFTAVISPVPTSGTVEFRNGATTIPGCATRTVNTTTGVATCQTTFNAAGAQSITAVYGGAADYQTSTSAVMTQTVAAGAAATFLPGVESFTVPAGWSTITVTAWGGSGGSVTPQYGTTQGGGTGGGVTSVINVTPGQVIQIVTGAYGGGTPGSTGALGTSGAGGGASDIRVGTCAATLSCGLADRVVVAGGGGGASAVSGNYQYPVICGGGGGAGADGSGAVGCTRNQSGIDWPHGGGGGTLTAGGYGGARSGYYGGNAGAAGAAGAGGSGAAGGSSGGSGGSGFFGGGGGGAGTQPSETANNVPGGGGGGGSSWATPTALSTSFLGSSRTGNGYVTIAHAVTQVTVSQSVTGDIPVGGTRQVTVTLRDSGGNPVVSSATVALAQTSGTGAVLGLSNAGISNASTATFAVTGMTPGSVGLTATTSTLTSTPLALTVIKADQSITFPAPAASLAYGSSLTITPTATSGATVVVAATGACTAMASGASTVVLMTSGTGTCELTATQAGSTTVNAAPSVVRTIAASLAAQASLVVSAPTSNSYGDTVTVTAFGGSGTGAVAFALTGPCTATASTATSVTLRFTAAGSSCSVTATKQADANYSSASSPAAAIAVTKRALAFDAAPATKVYGTADPAFTGTYRGFATGDTASSLTGSPVCAPTVGIAVGSYTITCDTSAVTSANYTVSSGTTAAFTITPRSLSITASSATITYRDATPVITPSYAGLAYSETSPATAPTCSTSVGATTPVGVYASECTGAVDPNYSIATVAGVVEVLVSAQVITFAQPSASIFGESFTVSPTSTSGLAVSVSASGGCSVVSDGSGWAVTMTSGTTACELTATQPGDANFTAAASVVRSVAAGKAAQAAVTVTGASSGIYGDSVTLATGGGSGSGAVSLSATGPCIVTGSTVALSEGVGTCLITGTKAADADYNATSTAHSITVTKRVLTVDAEAATAVYGESDPALTATIAGFTNGDDDSVVTGSADCTRAPGTSVGDYVITCAPGTLDAANYSFTTGSTDELGITPRDLLITASDATIAFGDATPVITAIYDGLAYAETSTALAATCSTAVDPTTDVGTYDSECAGAIDANYDISYATGTVTVVIASQTVAFAQPADAAFGSTFVVDPNASSGLPVVVSAAGGCAVAAATVGWQVTMTSGTTACTLTADQAGSGNFSPAVAGVTVAALLAPQAALVGSAPATAVYGSSHSVSASGGSGSGATTFVVTGPCTLSASTVTMRAGTGSCVVTATKLADADYSATTASTSVLASKATATVTVSGGSKTEGDEDERVEWAITGLVNGDTEADISGAPECAREPGEQPGSYAVTCSTGTLASTDYSFVFAGATFVITEAAETTDEPSATDDGSSDGSDTSGGSDGSNAGVTGGSGGLPGAVIAAIIAVILAALGTGGFLLYRRRP